MLSSPEGSRTWGLRGAMLGARRGPSRNVLLVAKFVVLLGCVARLRPGGMLWFTPPCATWVFVSRGGAGRGVEA
eukprot:8959488-Lingulodinium_polyedra.AAC.1